MRGLFFTILFCLFSGAAMSAESILYNGWFDVWQRGTLFTPGSNVVTADRWLASDEGGTVTREAFTPGQTDVLGNPKYFLRHAFTTQTANKKSVVQQRLPDVSLRSGLTVEMVFYAKASADTDLPFVRFQQDFGSGGSADVDVYTEALKLSTVWKQFSRVHTFPSVAGKTINAGSFAGVAILVPPGYSGTIDVARVELRTAIGEETRRVPYGEELARCQFFFRKTFPQETSPAQNAGKYGAMITRAASNGAFTFHVPYKMHRVPDVVTYNPLAANSSARNGPDSTDTAVTATDIGDSGAFIVQSGVPNASDANDNMLVHVTLDAEVYE